MVKENIYKIKIHKSQLQDQP